MHPTWSILRPYSYTSWSNHRSQGGGGVQHELFNRQLLRILVRKLKNEKFEISLSCIQKEQILGYGNLYNSSKMRNLKISLSCIQKEQILGYGNLYNSSKNEKFEISLSFFQRDQILGEGNLYNIQNYNY